MAPGMPATAISSTQRISDQIKSFSLEISIAVEVEFKEVELEQSFH